MTKPRRAHARTVFSYMMSCKMYSIPVETADSKLPLVEMVSVNGLNSQYVTEAISVMCEDPKEFKTSSTSRPVRKSPTTKQSLPKQNWDETFGIKDAATTGE